MRKFADGHGDAEKQPHDYAQHPEHNYEKLPLPVEQDEDFYYDIEHKIEREEYGPGGPAGYVPPWEPLNQDNLTENQIDRYDTGPMDEWFDSGFGTGIFWIKGPGVQATRGAAMKIASLLKQCVTYLNKSKSILGQKQGAAYWNISRVAAELENFLEGKGAVEPWRTTPTLEHAAQSIEKDYPLVAAHIDMVTNTLEKVQKFAEESKSKEKVQQYGHSSPIRKRYDYGEPGSWEYETTHNADAEYPVEESWINDGENHPVLFTKDGGKTWQKKTAVPKGYPFGFTRPDFVTPETDDIWRQAIDKLADENQHLVQKKDGSMGPNVSQAKKVYYDLLNSYAKKTE